MKKAKKELIDFIKTLSEEDSRVFRKFLDAYKEHLELPSPEEKLILRDAQLALIYLVNSGLTVSEAAERLSAHNLGGFYAHEALSWYPLDDAAKIYPISMKFGKMPIFRLSCYLKSDVIPEILQMALTFTIKRFPSFATIVRKGVFWHYLDSVKRRFPINADKGVPCQSLRISSIGTQSFQVLYHANRISVEFFHVLTDGTGGMVFLKTLVGEYLRILGVPEVAGRGVLDVNSAPQHLETTNDFERLCPKIKKSGGFAGPAAAQMGGRIARRSPCKVVQLVYDTEDLLVCAHSYGVSLSSFILALMFHAQMNSTEVFNGKIQMQVPVNMRKFFPQSQTLRNFSMYCSIDLGSEEITDFKTTAELVSKQLTERSTYDEMTVMMSTARKLVRSLRFIPLAVKSPVAKMIYGFLGDSRFSNTLSNLGRIELPAEISPYVEGFDFVLGTCVVSRASCSMCSFGNSTVLSISKNTRDPSFEERLSALSKELGLEVSYVETQLYD